MAASGPHTLLASAALNAGRSDVETAAAAAWKGATPLPGADAARGSIASESCSSAVASWSLAA
jgi:hypothetical protein